MNCEQARNLFDAYLDGELSPSLATELGAHRLKCSECRRELALLEVAGHIINAEPGDASPNVEFTDRLMACMESRRQRMSARFRRIAWIGAPVSAAALIALAFLGVFDRGGKGMVLGKSEVAAPSAVDESVDLFLEGSEPEEFDESSSAPRATLALQTWIESTQKKWDETREDGTHLRKAFDLTILQWLDVLEQAKRNALVEERDGRRESTVEPGSDVDPLPSSVPPTDETP